MEKLLRIIPLIILIGCTTLITFGININAVTNNINSHLKPTHLLNKSNTPNQLNDSKSINNIYKFLLADIALSRKQLVLAKENFEQLLQNTQDPRIAEILTEFAIETEDYPLLKTAVKEWAELAPDNFNAQLMGIAAWLGSDQILIEKFILHAIQANPEKIDTQLSGLLSTFPNKHQKLLQQALKSLVQKNPRSPTAQLCLAQISAQLNNIKIAQQATNAALKLNPSLTNAIFLQAKLIRYKTNSDIQALDYLQRQIIKFSKNEELHLFYVNALLDNHKNIEALSVVKKLLNSTNIENHLEANLLAAEIYLQQDTFNIKQAKQCLTKLINSGVESSKVYFMLGQIAEKQGEDSEAIRLYTAIEEEPYHIVSFFRAALLLTNNQQLSEAIDVLNQAQPTTFLEKKQLLLFKIELALELNDLSLAINNANQGLEMLPNDIDFLYARSLISRLNNQMLTAEKDLKHIISIQPENHNALNSLGFILTSDTNRQAEAFNYLQQALQLSPQNPVYMDSMGLLLYRMGKTSDSLKMLTNAYKITDDLNIAIHLGEVLWATGQKQQAKIVWKKAWETAPNNKELLNILNQYQIIFLNAK